MTHCNTPWHTKASNATMSNKYVMERLERQRSQVVHARQNWRCNICNRCEAVRRAGRCPEGSALTWLFLVVISFQGKGVYKGGGKIWKDWEMKGIGVHDVKYPKNQ